jgi:hypothetical protein
MRTFSTDTSAAALGISRKALDNILSREGRGLLARGRQGRSRRIQIDALERITVALILKRDLGVGITRGLQLAAALLVAPGGQAAVGVLGTLTLDVPRLRRTLEIAVDDALEGVAPKLRGRPRLRVSGAS